jgi:26 proteasome complex subunit DSS1
MASSTSKDTKPAEAAEKTEAKEQPTSLLPAKLEEDDEFEDFPNEGTYPTSPIKQRLIHADWTEENSDLPTGNSHLWEESWDDDDTNEDFAQQLKYVPSYIHKTYFLTHLHYREEIKKVEASKK